MVYSLLRNVTCALLLLSALAGAAQAQSRNALVIGNSAYQSAPALKTPATDAAIVAETLRAAGYAVTELHDLRQANIGQVMRDFLDKAMAGGSEGAAFVYYSGYGAQAGGENYLVPVDAVINNDGDVPDEAFRLNDLLDELAKTPLAARIVVLDASRDHKLGVVGGKPVAKGLAMGDTFPGGLLAFAAAPGATSTDGDLDYSLYTGALVTLMRQPGLDMEQIFKATRLQVNQATSGAQTPWMVSDLAVEVSLFAATAAAPQSQTTASGVRIPPKEERAVTKDMLRGLSPDDAYAVAIEEDTLESYQWFVELFPEYPLAAQVWDIIETRREAVLWRRTLAQNTTRAYWNYLKRYPNGAHVGEAQDQLAALSAATTPPAAYVAMPEPLPPDYYDEAVDVGEIVPFGYDAPPLVFDVLAPLFIPRGNRGPRDFGDRRRDRFIPASIPAVRGDPVSNFGQRSGRSRDAATTRDGKTGTGRIGTKTGINGGKTPIDKGSNIGGRTGTRVGADSGANTRTGTGGRKTGVALPPASETRTPTGARGTTPSLTTTTTTPGTTPGPTGTRTRRGGVALPSAGTRPTTPATTTGPTTGRPTAPGVTTTPTPGRPMTPDVATRQGLPPVPGTTPVKPTTPGVTTAPVTGRPTTSGPTTPGAVTTRPGLPPVPGTTPVRPATPATPPTSAQRPGLPPSPTPTAPTVRPPTPTTPTVHPPAPQPATPTVRPPPPTTPTVRPPTPSTPAVRPPVPAVRPAPPPRPPAPAVRVQPPPRAAPPPPRAAPPPQHAAPPPRPAPPPRAAAPPPRPAAPPRAAPPPRPAAPPPPRPACPPGKHC